MPEHRLSLLPRPNKTFGSGQTGEMTNTRAGTLRKPEDMTSMEFHVMLRSRVVGRVIKRHVPVKAGTGYETETAQLGKNFVLENRASGNNRQPSIRSLSPPT